MHRLRIELRDVEPAVWRAIDIASDTTLSVVSCVLLKAMGWQDGHLHEFVVGDRAYCADEEASISLGSIVPRSGDTFVYNYDLREGWSHHVTVESVAASDEYAPRCVAGEGDPPPENCGGPAGYAAMRQLVETPKRAAFNVYTANSRIGAAMKRQRVPTATRPNERWGIGLLRHRLRSRRYVWICSIIDLFTRECLTLEARQRFGVGDLCEVITRACKITRPGSIVLDRPPLLSERRVLECIEELGIAVRPSQGRVGENAYIMSFHGTLTFECLGSSEADSLEQVARAISRWRDWYNSDRIHSALHMAPKEFALRYAEELGRGASTAASFDCGATRLRSG